MAMNPKLRKSLIPPLALALFLCLPCFASAETETSASGCTLSATVITSGLNHPWGMTFISENEILITERSGNLLVFDLATSNKQSVRNVPEVFDQGQGGMLDVTTSQNYRNDATIFFSYAEPRGNNTAGTAVAKAILTQQNGIYVLENTDFIFRQSSPTNSTFHFGSRIDFAPDGTLFITIGDRGERISAQDPMDHRGSVVRINADGSIPDDNPFANGKDALPGIWSTGHRNPQGAAIHPETGDFWVVEHGARGGDEVNLPEAGKNYGWPLISYGTHYSGREFPQGSSAEGFQQPLYYWDPSIAPSGAAFVSGSQFKSWENDLLVGALKDQLLVRLDMQDGQVIGEERFFEGTFGRIRDVTLGPQGAIWLLTDDTEGKLVKISAGEGC